MTRAVLLGGDYWEALYIDGKLIDQHHSLNEGEERFVYFLRKMKEHDLTVEDFSHTYVTDEGSENLATKGRFPDDLEEALTWCEEPEKYEI